MNRTKVKKIIDVKEQEKNEVTLLVQRAVKNFEQVANELYKLLKHKETLIENYSNKMNKGVSIQELRAYQYSIQNIENTIAHYQTLFVQARNRMDREEALLLEKNIEVKKYQKIDSRLLLKIEKENKEKEAKYLDELSVLQYYHKK